MSDNTNQDQLDDQTINQDNASTSSNAVQIDSISSSAYIASSIERKRSLMMYYLFGIIMSLDKKDLSDFESFHIRQALWWWMISIVWIFLSIILSFIPYSWSVVVPLWLVLLVFFWMFNMQSLNGQYKNTEQAKWNLFYGLWSWLMLIFDT